jgi:DNA-binding PadR family transcriptional regulator
MRMLLHLILGLLRNGEPRHGYQLVTEHRTLTGMTISPGNVYRELSRLASRRLVRARCDEPGADGRRIPYQITDHGSETFDEWLLSPAKHRDELGVWLIFVDRVPQEVRDRVLERARDTLWSQSKALERAREDAVAKHGPAPRRYHPLPALLSRRLKQVTADLEFLNELRADLSAEASSREARADIPPVAPRRERPARGAKRSAR